MKKKRPSALVLALLSGACGGRIAEAPGEGSAPSVDDGATSGEAFGAESRGAGEDAFAYAREACAAREPFTAVVAPSPVALQGSLSGRWVVCPESQPLPDPLFGNAAYVGIQLSELTGAHPLLADGASVIAQPAAYGWTMTSATSFELVRGRGRSLAYDVVLGADGRSLVLSRGDLGDTPYALARLR